MARNETIDLTSGAWVQLTNGDATVFRVNVMDGNPVLLKATVGAVAPTDDEGAVRLVRGAVVPATDFFSELFPGVVGANRVYGKSLNWSHVSVSHD